MSHIAPRVREMTEDPVTAIQKDAMLDFTDVAPTFFAYAFVAGLEQVKLDVIRAYVEHRSSIGDKVRVTFRIEKE